MSEEKQEYDVLKKVRGEINLEEKIICSALYYDNKNKYEHQPFNINSGYVICGHRHHNCFMTVTIMNKLYLTEAIVIPIQGFLTNKNRFVNREEAFEIALKANQVLVNKERKIKRLFSEDIY